MGRGPAGGAGAELDSSTHHPGDEPERDRQPETQEHGEVKPTHEGRVGVVPNVIDQDPRQITEGVQPAARPPPAVARGLGLGVEVLSSAAEHVLLVAMAQLGAFGTVDLVGAVDVLG